MTKEELEHQLKIQTNRNQNLEFKLVKAKKDNKVLAKALKDLTNNLTKNYTEV